MLLTRQKKRVIIAGLLLLFLILIYGIITVNAKAVRIAVLFSNANTPYQEALTGFKQYLNEQGVEIDLNVHDLNGSKVTAGEAIKTISKEGARIIFTLGTFSTNEVLDQIKSVPIIAGMILKTEKLKGVQNATGIILDFPVETQFEMMRRLLPNARAIGVLYNPEQNNEFIRKAAETAKKMDLNLVLKEVHTPQELPDALRTLSKTADALWGINDSVVYTPETAKHILLFSYRNQIPFIGLSSEWVKAGALYSLDRDYKSIGRQCGEMAYKILQGADAGSIPLSGPREVLYSLNLKTAQQMKINFPEAVIQKAQTRY